MINTGIEKQQKLTLSNMGHARIGKDEQPDKTRLHLLLHGRVISVMALSWEGYWGCGGKEGESLR